MVGATPFFSSVGWSPGFIPGAGTPDVTAPTVVAFSPADDATGVAITTDLIATMSEPVLLGVAGTINLKRTSDNVLIQTWNVATDGGSGAGKVEVVGGTDLTMHLASALANSIEYYVIWDAAVVKDGSGNGIAALAVTTTWSFTTVASGGGGDFLLLVNGTSYLLLTDGSSKLIL